MKRTIVFLVVSCFLTATSMISLKPWLSLAEEKKKPELEIKMAHISPSGTPWWDRMDEWPARLVEKVSHGRIKVRHFPGNTLVPGPDMYRAIQVGIADFGWVYGAMNPGAFPLSDLFSLPGLFPNMATSNLVLTILYDKFPDFKKQFSPNVKHISSQVMLRSEIHSVMPIRTLADLKGKVIGSHDEISAKALKQLGASTTLIPLTEMYSSGQRGVVQGLVVAWGAFGNWRLYEIFKYHTLLSLSPVASHFLFSRGTWNKFTPEEQEKIELLTPWFQRGIMEGAAMPGHVIREKEILREKGHEIIVWPDEDLMKMRETFRPIWNEWAEKMESKGYPGKAILKEAERLVEMYGYRFG